MLSISFGKPHSLELLVLVIEFLLLHLGGVVRVVIVNKFSRQGVKMQKLETELTGKPAGSRCLTSLSYLLGAASLAVANNCTTICIIHRNGSTICVNTFLHTYTGMDMSIGSLYGLYQIQPRAMAKFLFNSRLVLSARG